VFLGNGDGTFQELPQFGSLADDVSPGVTSIFIADVNGDGKPDLISANIGVGDIGIAVFPGNGNGSFGSVVNFPLPTDVVSNFGFFINPVVADFNSDGKPGIAVGTGAGWVPLFYNTTNGFGLTASALSPSIVVAGNSPTSTVTSVPLFGFDGIVTLSCSGLPSGATCLFNPTSLTGSGMSSLTINTSANTSAGIYAVAVTGTSGSLKQTSTVSLNLQNFTVTSAGLPPGPVSPGKSVFTFVTVTGFNGFTDTVKLACSSITLNGSPASVAAPGCSFNPASVFVAGGAGFSILTVSTTGSSAALIKPSLRQSGLFYALWLPIAGIALLGRLGNRKRAGVMLFLLMIASVSLLPSCGGGNGSGGEGGSGGGTPAGTYTITVTGTWESVQRTTTVTLTVQ
jgi:hypothetical protein